MKRLAFLALSSLLISICSAQTRAIKLKTYTVDIWCSKSGDDNWKPLDPEGKMSGLPVTIDYDKDLILVEADPTMKYIIKRTSGSVENERGSSFDFACVNEKDEKCLIKVIIFSKPQIRGKDEVNAMMYVDYEWGYKLAYLLRIKFE
jgi:hypothetical protein